jgi:hypothetical protein
MYFAELFLGSDVYVMTLCICIRLGSSVIEIKFLLLLQLILEKAVSLSACPIFGDMESIGGDGEGFIAA